MLCDDRLHGFNYILHVVVGQLRRAWERKHAFEFARGDWEISGAVVVAIAVISKQMDGNEVHRSADISRAQLVNKGVPRDIQAVEIEAKHVEMPGMTGPGAFGWGYEFIEFAEGEGIARGYVFFRA